MHNTSISFPAGAMGPGMTPPFLVGSLIPGQGGVTGEYAGINVAEETLNQRVGPVRSPVGPVWGYRDQTRPLGPVAYIPTNIPGPIYPGVGSGFWHVGPKIVREGNLPLGTYDYRIRRKDKKFRTYGAYGEDVPEAYYKSSLYAIATGVVSGAVVGVLMKDIGPKQGAFLGGAFAFANQAFWGLLAKLGSVEK